VCKDMIRKNYFDEFHKSTNEIINLLVKLEKEPGKEDIINQINNELIKMDDLLNKKILCKECYEGKFHFEKLTDEYGNQEVARFLHDCKKNAHNDDDYVKWIPFNEFEDIEYLAKGGFGVVHKATWTNYYNKV